MWLLKLFGVCECSICFGLTCNPKMHEEWHHALEHSIEVDVLGGK